MLVKGTNKTAYRKWGKLERMLKKAIFIQREKQIRSKTIFPEKTFLVQISKNLSNDQINFIRITIALIASETINKGLEYHLI